MKSGSCYAVCDYSPVRSSNNTRYLTPAAAATLWTSVGRHLAATLILFLLQPCPAHFYYQHINTATVIVALLFWKIR